MNSKLKQFLPGIIITALTLITSAVFILILVNTKMLTTKVICFCGGALFLISALIYLFVFNTNHKIRTVCGSVIALLLIVAEVFGSYYILHGISMLTKVTSPNIEYSECSIFIGSNDSAKEIPDIKDYKFGILKDIDRDTTNIAISKLENAYGKDINIKEYQSLADLLDAYFTTKEIDALLLNKDFISILDNIEGLKVDLSKLREFYTIKAESEIPPIKEPINFDKKVFTVYITGIDGEGGLARKSRSDVNILATVNIETGQVLLISTPRDYYVPLSISYGIPDKLTHAGMYGTQVSLETIELLYGIEIDYYFKLHFDGFVNIIDSLGGVDVYSEYNINISNAGVTVNKGMNHLTGYEALYFARERKRIPSGERGRGIHQMAVIKAVIDKFMSPSMLQNYTEILDSISGNFDTNIPYDLIAKLIKNQLQDNPKWNITSYAVNGTGASKKPYSLGTNAYVMIPDQTTVDKAISLINQVKNGEVPTV